MNYYSIITNNGLVNHANASVHSESLDLVYLAVGDSNGTYYDPDGTENSLKNELHRTNLSHIVIDENNPNQLIIEGFIGEEIGPFYVREIGIFDSNGNLFAIGKFPETFKSNLPSGTGKKLYIRMILGFSNTPNITLIASDTNNDPNFSNFINSEIQRVDTELSDKLKISQNLNDLSDVQAARNNLGLKESATTDFTSSILSFAVTPPPDGWLECNGAAISRTTYANLFSKIGTLYGVGDNSSTFNIPDLRGEFIRGFDHGRGVDSGRSFSSFQNQSMQTHKHAISGSGGSAGAGGNPGNTTRQWDSGAYSGKNTFTTLYSLGGNTHPRNIALIYCIKY